MTVEAVVFDWGGTLSRWASVEPAEFWHLAATELTSGLDPDRGAELTDRLVAAEVAVWREVTTSQRSATLSRVITDAVGSVGLPAPPPDVVDRAGRLALDAWGAHVAHDPDASALLGELREQGLLVGLLSNTHFPAAFHDALLERDGLIGFFDARLYTSDLDHVKPHPAVFEAALAALGVDDPARAVYVGDRPLDDITGSKAVGMRAVLRRHDQQAGFDPAPPGIAPDATIDRLPDLLTHLTTWK